MATLEDTIKAMRVAKDSGRIADAKKLAVAVRQMSRKQPEYGAEDYAQSLGGGFNRGLLNLVDAPTGLANLALRQVTDYQLPNIAGNQESLVESARRTDVGESLTAPGAENLAGRIIGRVGEEIGASVIPAAGLTGAAVRGAGKAKGVWGAFANPIARTPARATVGEVAATTGAGAGAGIAQEGFPGDPLAETIGQVAGGFAPTALVNTPTALVVRGVTSVARRVSPSAQKAAGKKAVSDMMGREMSPEAATRLAEAERLRKEMPGFEPSLGEATGSEALIANQRRLESKATGRDLERLAARKEGSEAAVGQYAEQGGPSGEGGPDFIVDTAARRIDDLRTGIAQQDQVLTEGRESIARNIPAADKAARGAGIRERIKGERDLRRNEMNDLADELGISDADVTVQFRQAAKDIDAEFAPGSAFEDVKNYPAVLGDIKKVGARSEPVTFRDLKALRERVSDDLLDALRSPASRKRVRVLTTLKKRVDATIEELTNSADPALAGRYKQFRDAYFERYIRPFEEGAAYKVRERNERGFYRTPDEKVSAAFFEPGNVSAARKYNEIFGGNPSALADMEATALDSLRDFAVRDGVIKPKLFETWMRKHGSVLDEFPAAKKRLESIGAADQSLLARQTQLGARSRAVEDQFLTKELTAYTKGNRSAEAVLDAAIKEPRKMLQLKSILQGKPEAFAALKRHVWDGVSSGSALDIAKFIETNARSLSVLLTPRHLERLRNIVAARAMLERTPSPTGAAFIPRPFAEVEKAIGQGLPQLSSRFFAFNAGRMQKGYLVVESTLRSLRGRAATSADEVLKHALYDPALARELADSVTFGTTPPARAKRLQARLFALGLPLLEDEAE